MMVSSVVPPVNRHLERFAARYFDTRPMFVEPGLDAGIEIHYDNPQEVGADRVVNAVAAKARWGSPVIAVDFGTATTFDVVDQSGAYVGGVICPGLVISAEALFARASRLWKVDVRRPQPRPRQEHRGGHPGRALLRLHRAGGRHPRAAARGAAGAVRGDRHRRPGGADRVGVTVHPRGGSAPDVDRAATHLRAQSAKVAPVRPVPDDLAPGRRGSANGVYHSLRRR